MDLGAGEYDLNQNAFEGENGILFAVKRYFSWGRILLSATINKSSFHKDFLF